MMRWRLALGWICVALAMFAAMIVPARAADDAEHSAIFRDSCVLATPSAVSFEEANASREWVCSPGYDQIRAKNIWISYVPGPDLAGDVSLTGMAAPMEHLDLLVETRDGRMLAHRYSPHEIAQNWAPGSSYALPLPVAGEHIERVTIGIADPQTRLIITELGIAPTQVMVERRLETSIMFALAIGMMLIVALLCAVMFVAVRYGLAAYHSAFSVVLATHVLSASSLIFLIFPGMGLWLRTFVNFTSLAVGMALLGPIILRYFERDLMPVWLRKTIIVSAVLCFSAVLVLPLSQVFDFPDRTVYHMLFLPGCLTVAGTVLVMQLRGSRAVKGFALAWLVPVILGFERALRGSELYYLPNWMENLFFLGLAMQAVVMTIVIALKAETIRRERDHERFRAEQAREEAYQDGLTDLPNRRDFDMWRSRAHDFLAIIDLDHFKLINDRFGHDTGDGVLKAVGAALNAAQENGLVLRAWRLGGEEFAIALAARNFEEAALIANRVRLSIGAEIETRMGETVGPVTASAGLARNGDEPRQSYRAADSALYQAKAGGRDRLCFISEQNETTTIFPSRAVA